MTLQELDEILTKQADELIKGLSVSSYAVTDWSKLNKQLDPMKHKILDYLYYPKKLDSNQNDELKRTPLAFQELLVNRASQAMFSSPVERVYNYDNESEKIKKAADIIENIYRVKNDIDAENIDRSKSVLSSQQSITVWGIKEKQTNVVGEKSKFSLLHKTYSEVNGYKLYPIVDNYGDLICASISYKDENDIEHFETWTDKSYRKFDKIDGNWILDIINSKPINFMPVVYIHTDKTAWGGDAGTIIIEQIEEILSYQGMYIKKNSDPTFAMYKGKGSGQQSKLDKEDPQSSRKIIKLLEDGFIKDITWEGAPQAIKDQYERLRGALFELNQIADNSFNTMLNSNTSADNKDIIFADVKAKAIDSGSKWIVFFRKELEIVIQFAKVMFPSYANEFDQLSIRSKIKPYSVKNESQDADIVDKARYFMSDETAVRKLGLVDDVGREVEKIKAEREESANSGIL